MFQALSLGGGGGWSERGEQGGGAGAGGGEECGETGVWADVTSTSCRLLMWTDTVVKCGRRKLHTRLY